MRSRRLAIGTLALVLAIGCDSKGSEKAEGEGKTEAKVAAGAEGAGKVQAGADAKVDAKADAKADVKADVKADADAKADVDAAAAAAAELKPKIGGTIVVAGDFYVEVLAFVDGRIEALVTDARGAIVTASTELDLVVTLAAEGDAKATVDLAWDIELGRFVGTVEAGVKLVPGPVEVSVAVDGKASTGMLAELGLAVQASHGGQVMVAGDYSLEVVAEGGFVHVYAFDVAGAAHAGGDLDIDVDLGGGAGGKLDLKWDPPSASYKAEVKGDLDLEAKPIVVELRAGGELALAAVASFHASVGGAGKGGIDARAEIEPPSAKLDAKASAGAGAKGGAKVKSKSSASASGKASAKVGGGGAKASIGGKASAKGKIGFKLGG